MRSWAAVPDNWSAMGSYVRIEAGPEMRGPAPMRRRTYPLFWRPQMKPLVIAGIIVAVLGAVVLTRGLSYPSHRNVLHVVDLQASVEEQHAVPLWLGVVAVVGSALMIGSGLRG